MEGYHSPQLDVAVRLNTNEAPGPPPAAFGERLAEALAGVDWHRYPDRAYRGAAHGASPTCTASSPTRCSRPTARTRCCRRCCLTYGGPGRTAAVFEPTYALHSHIARITGTGRGGGRARRRLRPRPRRGAQRARRGRRRRSRSCARPTTPPAWSSPRSWCARVADEAPGLVVVDEAYGQFAPWSALELVDDERPLVVTRTFSKTWSMAAARLGYLRRARRGWSSSSTRSCCPTTSTRSSRPPARPPSAFVDEMQARVARIVEERGRWPARWPTCRSTCGRRAPTSCCSGRGRWPATRCGRRLVDAVGARAELRLVASPRRLPAGHDRHARRGRRLPRRPPRGALHDRPPAPPTAAASAPPRRPRSRSPSTSTAPRARSTPPPGCRSSTTCSTSSGATAGST